MSASVDLVRRFYAEWPGLAPAEIAKFLAEDCIYHHVSIDRPLVGPRAVAGAIEIYRARFEQVECEIRRISEDDGVVLCERVDRFWLPGGRIVEVPAMASIETRDGRISVVHDYFDVASLKRQVDVTEA